MPAFAAALLIGPMIPDAQNDGAGLVASLAGLSAAIAACRSAAGLAAHFGPITRAVIAGMS